MHLNNILILNKIILSYLKSKPYKLNISVTSRCNSICTHCNIWKTKSNKIDELSITDFDKLFSNLDKNIFWISLIGGEPFVRTDIQDIVKKATEVNKNIKLVNIVTNGLAKDKIIKYINKVKQISNVNFVITLSIEGCKEYHNSIRKVKDSYQKTIDTLDEIIKITRDLKNIEILVETTLNLEKLYLYEKFVSEFRNNPNYNAVNLIVTFIHKGNLYRNESDDITTPKKGVDYAFLKKIGKITKNKSFRVRVLQSTYTKKIEDYISNKIPPLNCRSSQDSFFMDSNGDLYPCIIWGEKLGNLHETNFKINQIIKTRKIKKINRIISKKKCPGCWTPCEANQSIIHDLIKNPHRYVSYLISHK